MVYYRVIAKEFHQVKTFFLFVALFQGLLAYTQTNVFELLVDTLPQGSGPHLLTLVQIEQLLDIAVKQGWNIFDLLNEGIPYLIRRQKRIMILGDDLRNLAKMFRLGDSRVDAVLPLPKIIEIQIGFPLSSLDGAADIRLSQTHSQFLELGEFTLQTRYGFRRVEGKSLADAYGITVKNGLFSFNMSHIERVPDPTGGNNPNFIAIHLHFFFRPKRWHIDPIRKIL